MDKQMTMSFWTDELAEVRTHKKEFLTQMDQLVPWGEWVKKIQPYYYKGERGNKPYDLELMLRIYVLQNLYNLADMAAMNEIIDSRAFSAFCGVDSSNQIPDGDTIGRFRNILNEHHMQEELFEDVRKRLQEKGLLLMKGTIVDSTLVAAPSSTKNRKKERDPDAHQVKKGNQWYFGFKGHIGVDRDTGLVNKIETTAANVHDSTTVPDLLEGTEEEVFGDSGYLGIDRHDDVPKVNREGKKIAFRINVRRSTLKKLPEAEQEKDREVEHAKSSIRSKVEHVFAVVKGMFRYRKTRLRGLPKVDAQLHMLFALANLVLADRPSVAA
jgi:IS5 family transposase